jgi:hypothetical protein
VRLLAVMPVFNEADRYLKEVIDHLLPIVDGHLFVYDDQSTDGSYEVVSEMGVTCARRGDATPGFAEHEGRFRQWGWETFEMVMRPEPGDWILAQDADEKLFGHEQLPALFNHPMQYQVLGVTFYHMWNETHYRIDKAWAPTVSSRLFRYMPGGTFNQRRLASGSEPSYVVDFVRQRQMLGQTPLVMQHLGYMNDEDKKAKHERYSKLDNGMFHSMGHINSIIDPNPVLVPWTLS